MKPIFRLIACSTLLTAAVSVAPAWSTQPPEKHLSVNELAAKPDSFVGRVAVIGRVAAVTPGKGFTLIDSVNCSNCATECLTDRTTKKIPFLWSGVAPAIKGVVLVQGSLAKSAKGFVFTADRVTKR